MFEVSGVAVIAIFGFSTSTSNFEELETGSVVTASVALTVGNVIGTLNWVVGATNPGVATRAYLGLFDSSGNLTLNGANSLRFVGTTNSNYLGFKAPATVTSNLTWTLPSADGTNGQVLGTNGSGTLSWVTPSFSGIIFSYRESLLRQVSYAL